MGVERITESIPALLRNKKLVGFHHDTEVSSSSERDNASICRLLLDGDKSGSVPHAPLKNLGAEENSNGVAKDEAR